MRGDPMKTTNPPHGRFSTGSDDSGALELKPETVSKIRDATQHLFARANESLARQAARQPAVREGPPPAFLAEAISRNGPAEVAPVASVRQFI
jgi:hypothetical protein